MQVTSMFDNFPDIWCMRKIHIPARGVVSINDPDAPSLFSGAAVPSIFLQIHPNPLTETSIVTYSLPIATQASLAMFDILGRQVALLVDAYHPAGAYTVILKRDWLPKGMYLVRLFTTASSKVLTIIVE